MFWSWLWGLAVRKAGLLKGVPEGQVNAYTAGAVGVARTCAKTVCVEVTVEVLGQGWGWYMLCVPPYSAFCVACLWAQWQRLGHTWSVSL